MKKTLASVAIAGFAVLGGAGVAAATDGPHAQADGLATNSPGAVSGNLVQAPVDAAVNVVGNSANVVGVGNAAHDNFGENY